MSNTTALNWKIVFSMITLFLTPFNIFSATELVLLDNEIPQAKKISTIRITGYSDQYMYFTTISGEMDSLECGNRTYQLELNRHEKDPEILRFRKPVNWLCWPEIGETVLVIIDQKGKVRIFGEDKKTHFSFWCPNDIPWVNQVLSCSSSQTPMLFTMDGKQVVLKFRMQLYDHVLAVIAPVNEKPKKIGNRQNCGYTVYWIIGSFFFLTVLGAGVKSEHHE